MEAVEKHISSCPLVQQQDVECMEWRNIVIDALNIVR